MNVKRMVANLLFSKSKELKLLMVGLDAAGKTTILHKLQLGECISTIPAIGFYIEFVDYKKVSFTVWDVGGEDKIRVQWRNYIRNMRGVIFVVDSNDRDRIPEARSELHLLLKEDELKDACVLIIANKQDLPNAMSITELSNALDLNNLLGSRIWYIQPSSSFTGDGLFEGFDWIVTALNRNKCTTN